jgi:hypothetical protein
MDKEPERRDKKAPLAPAARCANYVKIGGSEESKSIKCDTVLSFNSRRVQAESHQAARNTMLAEKMRWIWSKPKLSSQLSSVNSKNGNSIVASRQKERNRDGDAGIERN